MTTPEMLDAIDNAVLDHLARDGGAGRPLDIAIFLAGMRAAADECMTKVPRDADYGGRWGGYGRFDGDMTGPECADRLRALAGKLEQL